MKNNRVFHTVLCALMTALTVILSQIAIPTPFGIPLTLQTFAVCLCGFVLGIRYGTASMILYVLMGAIGLPVFFGFHGGISCIIAEPTGGFILGFIPLALMCGLKKHLHYQKHGRLISLTLATVGIITCHIFGILLYSAITHIPFLAATAVVSLPFITKDVISCVLAYFISNKIIYSLNKNGYKL